MWRSSACVRRPNPAEDGLIGVVGLAESKGGVRPEDGITVAERQIGWGVYGVESGDGTRDAAGIEVRSTVETAAGAVEVDSVFVTPDS